MSRIKEKFNELKSRKEKALVSYIMVGYPNDRATISAVKGLVKGGADLIELGFPFSDPIADGPTIQKASSGSLNNKTKIEKFFKLVKKIRKQTSIPLILMTYTIILYKQGYQQFIKRAKNAGIDGLILPDMSIEESKNYLAAAKTQKMDTIFLVSPNTKKDRLNKIAKASSGFLYMVAVFGTTGVQTKIHQYTVNALKSTKRSVGDRIPVVVGFGISTEKDVKKYASFGADAMIVGSANIKIMENTPISKLEKKISAFTKKLKNQTK